MSFSLNPQLINEIWEDYKYPSTDGISQTGYNKFDDYEFNEKSYDYNENIQGNKQYGDTTNPPLKSNVFEGFQINPMDHPSVTKSNIDIDTYNNKPYDYQNGPPRQHTYQNYNRGFECNEHIDHILRCRYCYEHIRKKLNLDDNNNNNNNNNNTINSIKKLFNGNINNLLNISLIVMSGIFILLMTDTILSRRRR